MDSLTQDDLEMLIAERTGPCISIFMTTHPSGREGENDPLRLTQLVDRAEARLVEEGMRSVPARELVKPLRDLVEDERFWRDRSHGLAVFLSGDLFRRYRLPVTLPTSVVVGPRLVTRPLLPLLTQDLRFLLLALSLNRVRLFEGNRYRVIQREVPGMPTDMEETLNITSADQGRKQFHMAGRDSTIFHGHGGKPDVRKDDILSFFRLVDAALQPILRDEKLPLLMAGVGYLLPIYREVNSYAGLAEQQLESNCDYLSDAELHQRAWPIVEEMLAAQRKREIDSLYGVTARERCATDIRAILPAAAEGRVELLLVDNNGQCTGSFEPSTGAISVRPNGDAKGDDLLDIAARETLLHRGRVFSVNRDEIPEETPIAAVLRY